MALNPLAQLVLSDLTAVGRIPPESSASSRSAISIGGCVRECLQLGVFEDMGGGRWIRSRWVRYCWRLSTGVSEALGGQLWAGVVSLVRRPSRRKTAPGAEIAAVPSGEDELAALQQAPA